MKDHLMTLDEYRKSHPMDLDTVLQIGLDICRSLENGIPHGEINTTGICVTEDWEFVFHYDEIKESDMASDIYALGMLMYRLLNKGRLPFMPPYPEKVTKEDKEEAVRRCLAGERFPVPLDGDEQITEVLRKACNADRSMRFETPAEMHTALTAASVPLAVSKPKSTEKISGFVVPEAQPVAMEFEEEDESERKQKKRKIKKEKKSFGSFPFQIVFVLLAALLSVSYVFLTKNVTLADSKKSIQIGFTILQIVLLFFATKSQIVLRLMGILTVLDGFCTITQDLFLVRMLERAGREFPSFYKTGYLVIVLPIIMAIFYLTGRLVRGKLRYLKNKFYAVILTLVTLLMLILSVTGMNRMVLTLELYPYATGILVLIFSLLAMENSLSRIPVRIFSFFNICLMLAVMGIRGFYDMIQSFNIPTSLVEEVFLVVMFLFSVLIFLFSGRKKEAEEDDEE